MVSQTKRYVFFAYPSVGWLREGGKGLYYAVACMLEMPAVLPAI
jgi:hypothetical protein